MKDNQENSIKEAWVLSLILGFIMINFPFIHIFNSAELVLGIPKLVLYFFLGWPFSIAVIWFFVRCSNKDITATKETVEDQTSL